MFVLQMQCCSQYTNLPEIFARVCRKQNLPACLASSPKSILLESDFTCLTAPSKKSLKKSPFPIRGPLWQAHVPATIVGKLLLSRMMCLEI